VYPYAGLVQATNGNFYGTTEGGGASYGTVFKITPSGTLTTLYTFCSQSECADGDHPYGGLVQATSPGFLMIPHLAPAAAHLNPAMRTDKSRIAISR
jgi:uncharacterized repeat protein (TIGR03803 family)